MNDKYWMSIIVFRLIVSLCSSDMLICIGILLYLAHQESSGLFASQAQETCIILLLRSLRITSHLITLLNLLGLALDHYFAIVKPLDYPILMSRKRANGLIVGLWILACLLGLSDFYIPKPLFSYCNSQLLANYCERVFCSKYNGEYILFAMALACFILMSIIYVTICVQLKKYHEMQQEIRNQVKRNKKGLVTTIIILIIFIFCWMPYCLFEIVMILSIQHSNDFFKTMKYFKLMNKLDFYLFDILLLNPILDAVIYSLRMREVQQGYRNIVRRCKKRRHLRDISPSRSSGRISTYMTSLSSTKQHSDIMYTFADEHHNKR